MEMVLNMPSKKTKIFSSFLFTGMIGQPSTRPLNSEMSLIKGRVKL